MPRAKGILFWAMLAGAVASVGAAFGGEVAAVGFVVLAALVLVFG